MLVFREIITKAVLFTQTKKINKTYDTLVDNANSVIGCFIINHNTKAVIKNNKVEVDGFFDSNIWYLKDDNTATDVAIVRNEYNESIIIDENVNKASIEEAIVNIKQKPSCINASVENNKIIYEIELVLTIDVVGNAKIKIECAKESEEKEENNIDNISVNYLKE